MKVKEENIISNEKELAQKFVIVRKEKLEPYHIIENAIIDYDINLRISDDTIRKLRFNSGQTESEYGIVDHSTWSCNLEFLNTTFKKTIYSSGDEKDALVFDGCEFYNELRFRDIKFAEKIKFKNCTFHSKQSFQNIIFKNDIEFFNCEFKKVVIFYKVQFEKNINLTSSTFHENLLFSYSKFSGLGVFNRVIFKSGLDLSIATFNKYLTFFETKIDNFSSEKIDIHEERHFRTGNSRRRYDISVTGSGKIPTLNKRETFRIIKHQLHKEGNNIDAFRYNSLEKQAYQQQLIEQNKNWFNNQDSLMFSLNNLSNKHKNSWLRGIGFTASTAIIFYIISIFTTGQFYLTLDDFIPTLNKNASALIVFLNPTHNPNFIKDIFEIKSLNAGYYIFDFIGRIFIGYGIYQTVQAFRKFR
jgi:hypothetical protein